INEARLIAKVEHAHILTVYDLGLYRDDQNQVHPYMVMQYADGGSLFDRLHSGLLSPDECLPIVKQIAQALDHAHSQNVVHLDLKPANVLFDKQGNALVADFGLAQLLQGDQGKAITGAGTPGFMPPEQWLGQDIGPFSDVYALGMTLHVMLTGLLPTQTWAGPTLEITLDNTIDPKVLAVIETAVSPDPRQRYATAGDLAAALAQAVRPAPAVPAALAPATSAPALSPRPLSVPTPGPQDVADLRDAMRDLGGYCEANPKVNEREVVTYAFKQAGLFAALGYGQPGQDALLEHKHADVVLRATGGRVTAVVEFKRPERPPQDGLEQLEQRYVGQLLPDVGVLCNGRQLIIYRRQGNGLLKPAVLQVDLAQASDADARMVYQWLGKREIDLADLNAFTQALNDFSGQPVAVRGPEEGGGQAFLTRFALKPETVFGRLVEAMMQTLPDVVQASSFASGAYSFWRRIYARELKSKDAPQSWRPFLPNSQKETLYRFMFSLESAYAVLSRLLLARAMDNHNFPNLDLTGRLHGALGLEERQNRLPPHAYAAGLKHLFNYTGNQAFKAIFESDIFDWWHDVDKTPASPLGERLAETILAVFNFDFQPMSGDLLGSLYQSYFDADTRKALGEFYTPPEVVRFILNEVGYDGNFHVRHARLLDPACGSGTFLIAAVQRYLFAARNQPPAETLQELLGGLKIVGFDLNPFAVLMAQVNYAAQIIPLFAQALQQQPGLADQLTRLPIPVLRTDSLRQEYREGEQAASDTNSPVQLNLLVRQTDNVSIIQAELPVEISPGRYFEAKIPVPRYDKARMEGWVGNAEEYFTALRVMFDAVGRGQTGAAGLKQDLERAGLTQHAQPLADFMQDAARELKDQMDLLRQQYEDGRFLKTLADLALALALKGDVQYDYVVGNPPYIRIQTIPELFRRRWEGWYQWAEGNFDAYVPFLERAIHLEQPATGVVIRNWLKPGGKLGYIIPNRFLLANYAAGLRENLPVYASIRTIFDFRDSRVFTGALNYPAILILENGAWEGEDTFRAVRVFADPRSGAEELIDEAESLLLDLDAGQTYARGQIADAFRCGRDALQTDAWLLMPPQERAVFEKIEQAALIPDASQWPQGLKGQNDRPYPRVLRLEDLTLTRSGGFQGYATSDDDVMIFRLLEERENTLLLRPKGAGKANWQGPERVEIEKELLRPWLFGRDVERWYVAWDGWYVFYPYAEITAMERRGGTRVPVTRYRLIPAEGTADTFRQKHKYTDPFPLIDQQYPLAWHYVNLPFIEQRLRGREYGKFLPGKPAAHTWYGATRPQNLDYYPQEKIVLQVSSTDPDV
ncbi:MAG TPA: hypothetical protein ENK32_06255, partial [Anaerolineae bacterium]|nr:hypothetical protein [Anaerolineae bacterium]